MRPSSRLAARKNKVVNAAGRYEIELELTSSTPVVIERPALLGERFGTHQDWLRPSVTAAGTPPQPGSPAGGSKTRLFPADRGRTIPRCNSLNHVPSWSIDRRSR